VFPPPYDLPVPPYHFLTDTTIRIGENPDNVKFDFGSIRRINPVRKAQHSHDTLSRRDPGEIRRRRVVALT
jgi:hypothetical protein